MAKSPTTRWFRAGRVTLRGVPKMSPRQRQDLAAWFRRQAHEVVKLGYFYSPTHTSSFEMRADLR